MDEQASNPLVRWWYWRCTRRFMRSTAPGWGVGSKAALRLIWRGRHVCALRSV